MNLKSLMQTVLLLFSQRYLGYSVPERVAGIDLMQELLHLANEKGYSVYFFGAKEEVLIDMLAIFKRIIQISE